MFYCDRCENYYRENTNKWCCDCGAPFSYRSTIPSFFPREKITSRSKTIWRYLEALPVESGEWMVSLGEGCTPLVPALFEEQNILFKLDFVSHSASYKDRGTALLVSKLREYGIKKVVEDSSGNAGAALAAYCANAGIVCEIFVPAYTSKGKVIQIEVYGALVRRIPGSREDTAMAVKEAARKFFYASHNWNPYFIQGIKTLAFELWEQMHWKAPDNIVVPAGQGSLVLGCYLGFQELKKAGEIKRLPRIFAVQAKNCAPLALAFQQGLDEPVTIKKRETIAEGISSAMPVRGREVLSAVRESDGMIISVEEKEILGSLKMIAKNGFYIEPTSAAATAGFSRLIRRGIVKKSDSTVVVLTGSGLKATNKIKILIEKNEKVSIDF